MFEQLLEYDRQLLVYLNNLGIEKYDLFWSTITQTVYWIPLFVLFVFLIYRSWVGNRPWLSVVAAVSTLFVTLFLTVIVKSAVARIRPSLEEDFSKLLRVLTQSDTFSFFSGHAASSFALTTVVVLLVQRKYPWAPLLYFWPVLFSFSRIYVGVHYPSDIFAGTLVGISMGIMGYHMHNRWRSTLAI